MFLVIFRSNHYSIEINYRKVHIFFDQTSFITLKIYYIEKVGSLKNDTCHLKLNNSLTMWKKKYEIRNMFIR